MTHRFRIFKRATKGVGTVGAFLLVGWIFIGIEEVHGDVEMGDGERFFIKHRPSLQWTFSNPAIPFLDVKTPDNLSIEARRELPRFCLIRYGTESLVDCYRIFCKDATPIGPQVLAEGSSRTRFVCANANHPFWKQ
jgi:hypothetical protein